MRLWYVIIWVVLLGSVMLCCSVWPDMAVDVVCGYVVVVYDIE